MKFSIITATYNSQSSIFQCLSSILNQTYSNFEIVLVDGVSIDDTLQIIQEFHDSRIKVVSEPDNGLYDALNKGITRATGDIIGFLHSDDFFANPNVLENLIAAFHDEKVHGVYSNLKYVSQENPEKVLRNWKSKEFQFTNLKYGWMPPHPTLFLRKEVYQQIGSFNTRLKIAADYDFILRLFTSRKFKIQYLNIYITHMRMGGASNGSLNSILRKSSEDYQVISQFKLWGIFTLIFKNLRKLPQFLKISGFHNLNHV